MRRDFETSFSSRLALYLPFTILQPEHVKLLSTHLMFTQGLTPLRQSGLPTLRTQQAEAVHFGDHRCALPRGLFSKSVPVVSVGMNTLEFEFHVGFSRIVCLSTYLILSTSLVLTLRRMHELQFGGNR